MGRMATILLVASVICALASAQKVETLKLGEATAVSYTHLTLPTNREV